MLRFQLEKNIWTIDTWTNGLYFGWFENKVWSLRRLYLCDMINTLDLVRLIFFYTQFFFNRSIVLVLQDYFFRQKICFNYHCIWKCLPIYSMKCMSSTFFFSNLVTWSITLLRFTSGWYKKLNHNIHLPSFSTSSLFNIYISISGNFICLKTSRIL